MIPVAAVISGAVIKASVLGLIRFLPQIALPDWGMAIVAIGLFGALYGVAIGLTQKNPKTILAYSSVSQMGFIITIIGMGIMLADESSRMAAAFYAARHVLAKGGLFLAIGVIAASSLRRYWLVFTPVILIALSIAGLPFTGGALAKSVTKDIMGDGLAYTFATMSSVASTLLMLHFLRMLKTSLLADPEAIAPRGKSLPWLVLAWASLIIPVAIYCFAPSQNIADALQPYAIWAALWPILLGGVLALALSQIKIQCPEINSGDIGSAVLKTLARPAESISSALVKMDAALGRWPVAAMTLLSLVLLFGAAIVLGR
jgi:formate hydrogenlyase subunit 3/multisubunit Na+/H+ antiporter MnhD subunit